MCCKCWVWLRLDSENICNNQKTKANRHHDGEVCFVQPSDWNKGQKFSHMAQCCLFGLVFLLCGDDEERNEKNSSADAESKCAKCTWWKWKL